MYHFYLFEASMVNSNIPTIDLSSFFNEGNEDCKKEVIDIISHACSEYGFFQIVNHGVPPSLMTRALEVSKMFFEYPLEEKLKSSPTPDAPLPTGYSVQPEHSADKNEYLLMFPPGSSFNVFPDQPAELRKVMEDIFSHFSKAALLVETILNDCLGLPPKFLQEYNKDRSWDFMAVLRYLPGAINKENNNIGLTEHQDGNCITFVLQDEIGGLEVLKNGEWIPVVPTEGSLIVNLGDVIQVLSNNKFKSATHRVMRQEGKFRHSYVFFNTIEGNKWVEPLPNFIKETGKPAQYRGFFYKDYQQMRIRNKTHPPSRPEDVVDITHYAIDC
ncbi:hypothetical protein IFM89_001268 [Coptis chinensis]|uniref:Fe2OG dioxygenase domain-containing protein n=1 Tax=Coptis chinensis TaxID=261450 RepID=A0A835H5M5_9MAGN|nr:hypothetical protein IFM89_001268 [Coptis chinensis]